MYEWFADDRNRLIVLVLAFSPFFVFFGGAYIFPVSSAEPFLFMLLGFIVFYLCPTYIFIGVLFIFSAMIRLFLKLGNKYYWWLGVVMIVLPLIILVGLAMLSK
jgi:hypothetical protein